MARESSQLQVVGGPHRRFQRSCGLAAPNAEVKRSKVPPDPTHLSSRSCPSLSDLNVFEMRALRIAPRPVGPLTFFDSWGFLRGSLDRSGDDA